MLIRLNFIYFTPLLKQARVAQLVEHDLAKVGVASSNLVSCSWADLISLFFCLHASLTFNYILCMKIFVYCLLWLIVIMALGCSAQESRPAGSNRLINAQSTYLLQHAYNPVDWYPWGDEALEKAAAENKLMLVSIGYAACHWCHVMEKESFEDSAVAALMNKHFVSIKVDREERPDIDNIYMSACQLMSPQGCGWPLNVITLPDQRPIFAGTYFPRDQWMKILERVQNIYEESPSKAEDLAAQVTARIQGLQAVTPARLRAEISVAELETASEKLIANMDKVYGGRKGAPKFPMPINLNFLLEYYYFTQDKAALQILMTTLDEMARGGIYDHLGGGFARYSTDEAWKVPHFEKMLYDNAQLVSIYADTYRMTQNPVFKDVIIETLEFVGKELRSPEGGFYSSLDADSEGEEGKYYIWQQEEIIKALGEEAELFCEWYQVNKVGNWEEGKNILYREESLEAFADGKGLEPGKLRKSMLEARKQLLELRNQRIRPGLDDKQITAWNAMMLKGYVDAFIALGDSAYLETALRNARFLRQHCIDEDGSLKRIYKDGSSSVNAFLDDYAFLAQAFISLYQVTFEEEWLNDARSILTYTLEHFFDEPTQTFYYTSDIDEVVLARTREMTDNVIPASNSVMGHLLFQLGTYFYKDQWLAYAASMSGNMKENFLEAPGYYANWGLLAMKMVYTPLEVAILGENALAYRKQIEFNYFPEVLYLGGATEGKLELLDNKLVPGQTTIYVCQNKTCKLPVTTVGEGLELIQKPHKASHR